MKYLVFLALVGCAIPKPVQKIDRIENCVYRLVENNGIEPEKAEKTCNRIFVNRYEKR